jgi:hypothetical protein
MPVLRYLETQGLYQALRQDIAEALDVDITALNVSSDETPAIPEQQETKEQIEGIEGGKSIFDL